LVQHEAQEEFLALKKQHKEGTACYIEAHDKPRVTLWQNRWYQFYIDSAMYVYVGKGNSEMFYFTPAMPKLHLKQLYMSIRYFEYKLNSLPGATNELIHQIQSFKHPHLYAEWCVALGRECGPNYSARHGLAKDNVLANPRKVELLNLLHHTKEYISNIYKIYNDGLQTVKEITGIDVVTGEMPGIMSKQYYIKDFSRPL
jgi:hypothetical protein